MHRALLLAQAHPRTCQWAPRASGPKGSQGEHPAVTVDPSGGAYLWDLPTDQCGFLLYRRVVQLAGGAAWLPSHWHSGTRHAQWALVAPLILRTTSNATSKNPAAVGARSLAPDLWNDSVTDDTPPGCTITAALGAINNATHRAVIPVQRRGPVRGVVDGAQSGCDRATRRRVVSDTVVPKVRCQ